MLALGIGAFVVAAVPFAVRSRRRAHRLTITVMGTIADLVVVDDDPRRARAALDAAAGELREVDARMSRFSAQSEIGRLNTTTRGAAVPVSPATALVVRNALDWAERTDGRFDPCLGLLSEHWAGSRPAVATYADARLYRALDLGRHENRDVLVLTENAASVDLGGIAKATRLTAL